MMCVKYVINYYIINMDALTALQTRASCPQLESPAPDEEQRQHLQLAALRAADHGSMRPWRYLCIQGQAALGQLGQLFVRAAKIQTAAELTESQCQFFLNMPLRAPLIYVAICSVIDNPRVPREEQLMATACSVQNLITAAFALGFGAYWRTGDMAFNQTVKIGLGLAAHEEIIGFIYLGTPSTKLKTVPNLSIADFFTNWPS